VAEGHSPFLRLDLVEGPSLAIAQPLPYLGHCPRVRHGFRQLICGFRTILSGQLNIPLGGNNLQEVEVVIDQRAE
jgi:hypothetical protein